MFQFEFTVQVQEVNLAWHVHAIPYICYHPHALVHMPSFTWHVGVALPHAMIA